MNKKYKQSEDFIVFRNTLWRKGYTVTAFAEKISMTRQNIYSAFQTNNRKTIDKLLDNAFKL